MESLWKKNCQLMNEEIKRKPTDFESRIYEALREIPRGKVTTYAFLARHLQCGSSQAVGQALKRNPFAPKVPCHRVIRTDGTLGGYSGKTEGDEITRKIAFLKEEGVDFDEAGKLIDPARLWNWEKF